ncbi:hypothetical protein [Roseinatronobacter monicus]|uniref:Uncharacterized protein n=1 Tax=Roseinatronobacter monicus TaxID=393481 RepID=A0A543K3A4_9RHOB|nr:hypothetical protein [Roseinatronobacter monicus]TQM89542.1 hypothetical protein BD293_4564 [Roseinatronobacter monicus]
MSKFVLTALTAAFAGFSVYFLFDSQLPVWPVFFAIFLYSLTLFLYPVALVAWGYFRKIFHS